MTNIPSIWFNSSILLERFKDFKASTCFFVCLSKAFTRGEYVYEYEYYVYVYEYLACSII